MSKGKKSKQKTYNYEEFKKEFYTKKKAKHSRGNNAFYNFGVRIARESLSEIRHSLSS